MERRLGPAAITLIVVDAVLIVVLVVLLLTAPDRPAGGDATGTVSDPPTSASEPSSDATTSSSTQAVTAPADALELAEFVTPSGNIWCNLTADAATCQIEDIEYEPPSIPDCADNDLAGKVITVTTEGAQYPCPSGGIGGTKPDDRAVLAYDETTHVGDFMCTSDQDGVTCTNLSTAARFTITRYGPSLG